MRQESNQGERPALLASGPAAGAGQGQGDSTVALPRIAPVGARLTLPRPRVALTRPIYGPIALGVMVVACAAVATFAAAEPSWLVPRSGTEFPGWISGPLHGLFGHLIGNSWTLEVGFSVVLLAMTAAYGVALAMASRVSMRAIVICVAACQLLLLLSPPLQLTDLGNYIAYARLGALHGLNPYTHAIALEAHDPVFRLSTWHHLHSPYGPLFTLATYPFAFLPLPVAFWTLKVLTVLTGFGFLALVVRCARQLGRDPRFVLLFVAANPLFLIYGVGGFHNDVFMLLPAMGAITLLLDGRERSAGASLMLAVAVKFTALVLLPFLLLAARPLRRQLRLLSGAAVTAVVLGAASFAAFGFSLPNLADQSSLLTVFSVPNVTGFVLGIGGATPGLLRLADVAVVLVVVLLLRRRRDWLAGAGWATLALLASLAWLVPWYIAWALPLAALAGSARLRRATQAFSIFLLLAYIPVTMTILNQIGVTPTTAPVYHASAVRQFNLEH